MQLYNKKLSIKIQVANAMLKEKSEVNPIMYINIINVINIVQCNVKAKTWDGCG